MARNNETTMTLNMKISKLLSEKKDLETKYKKQVDELSKQISKLTKQNTELRAMKTVVLEDEEFLKAMLEEKAKNKTISMIKREFNLKYNKDLTNQDIIDRIGNIQDLSIDLQEFYYKKMKDNNKNREIIDEIERKNDLDRFNILYDKLDSLLASLDEDNPEHKQLIINTTDKMVSLMDKKNKINKDVIGDNKLSGFKEDVDKIMENYNKTNILSFKATKRQVE